MAVLPAAKKNRTRHQCQILIPRFLRAIDQLRQAGLTQLVHLSDTLHAWREEIATMWRFTRNNGITEGFHNRMELISLSQLVQLGQTLTSWSVEIATMWRFTRNNGITEGCSGSRQDRLLEDPPPKAADVEARLQPASIQFGRSALEHVEYIVQKLIWRSCRGPCLGGDDARIIDIRISQFLDTDRVR